MALTTQYRSTGRRKSAIAQVILIPGSGKIIINGNTRTTDKVIRRQMAIVEGDSYSKYLINLSNYLL